MKTGGRREKREHAERKMDKNVLRTVCYHVNVVK